MFLVLKTELNGEIVINSNSIRAFEKDNLGVYFTTEKGENKKYLDMTLQEVKNTLYIEGLLYG